MSYSIWPHPEPILYYNTLNTDMLSGFILRHHSSELLHFFLLTYLNKENNTSNMVSEGLISLHCM